jgi:hypothetical protein
VNLPRLTAEASIYKVNATYRSPSGTTTGRGVNLSQDSLPPGSYLNSCSGCYIYHVDSIPMLHCSCLDFNGNSRETDLPYTNFYCFGGVPGVGDIANCNGTLTCGGC